MFIRKHWFKFALLGIALLCLVGIFLALIALWNSMIVFEAQAEIGAVTEYFNRFAAGDYETAADTSGFPFDEKSPREDYIRYLKEEFGSDFSDLRFAGRDGTAAGERIYRVYSGNQVIGQVCLVPVEGGLRNWNVVALVDYAEPIYVEAPSYVTVTAAGLVQTPREGEPILDGDFDALQGMLTVPTRVKYTVEGFLYSPEVVGTAPNGTPCLCSPDDEGVLQMTVPAGQATSEYEQLMTEFAQMYAQFVSKDAGFHQLRVKMLSQTPFYKAASTFDNYWYITHNGFEFRNTEISDVVCPDQSTFAGTIRFDHVVFLSNKEHVYPSAYRLSFCLVDGAWLLADLNIL